MFETLKAGKRRISMLPFKSGSMSCDAKWHAAIPQCASAGLNISANLNPPSHSLFVPPPLVPKSHFELPLFAPHHKPPERPMADREDNAAERTKDQRSAEEDKHVTTEIERISRKAVRAIRDQVSLSRKYDDIHLAAVKVIRRPHSQKKAGRK